MLFQVIDWNFYHELDEEGSKVYKIRLFGRTNDNKTIYVCANNFKPYFFVKLDKFIRRDKIAQLIEDVKKRVYPKENVNGLIKYETEEWHDLYGFTDYSKIPFLKLVFDNYDAFRSYERAFGKEIRKKKYCLYESNIEPNLRSMHIQNLDSVGWIKIDDYEKLDSRISCCDINIECNYTNLIRYEDTSISSIIIASFDIECVSEDGSFPQAERDNDQIIQIGTSFSRFGESECYYRHIVTLGRCKKLDGIEIESYLTEKEMLLAWTDMIRRTNPDVITGYNIFGFDFEYMMKRAKKLNIEKKFSKLSRITDEYSEWKEKKLASSALGENILKYYDMTGRVIVDLMKVAQRDFKLASYKLDYVASSFIKEGVTKFEFIDNTTVINTKSTYGVNVGQYITIFYNDGITDNKHMDGKKFKILDIQKNKLIVNSIIEDDIMSMGYKVFWCQAKDDISPQDIFSYQKKSPLSEQCKYRSIIAKYCIQDTELVCKLMAKLQVLTNNIGMANVCHVPLSYLFMRGQGIKIFSLVSKKCREERHLIPVLKKPKKDDAKNKNVFEMKDGQFLDDFIGELNKANDFEEEDEDNKYEGAIVFPPKKGVYFEPIPVLDFNSLYPMSMIMRNLSHECCILDDNLDEKYGYLKTYKYHEITYNTSYDFSEIYKEFKSENNYIDFFRIIFNIFIPKMKLDYTNVFEDKKESNIIAKHRNTDGFMIEEPIIIKDDNIQKNIKYILRDSYKNMSAIIKIIMLNVAKLSKVFLNKSLKIVNNKEKHKFEIYTTMYRKEKLWIELEYKLKQEKITIYKVCKFAEKADGSKGIIPCILQALLDARKKYKNQMEEEPDNFKKSILDGLQLAYKCTANSLYGQTGAPTSSIFMKDIAASTTATGRQMLQYSRYFVEEHFGPMINYALTDKKKYIKFANKTFDTYPYLINSYGNEFKIHIEPNIKLPEKRFSNPKAGYSNKEEYIEVFYNEMNKLLKPDKKQFSIEPKIIYGDSVVGDTPLILKNKITGNIEIKTIESLNNEWYDYRLDTKEYNTVDNYDIWTETGWTKINKVIRHKTNKNIYEVLTHIGCVRVTEDHSLISKNNKEVKPIDCKVGDELMHSYPEIIINQEEKNKLIYSFTIKAHNSEILCNEVPDNIINGTLSDKLNFMHGYCMRYTVSNSNFNSNFNSNVGDETTFVVYTQLNAAKLFYLVKSLNQNAIINKSDEDTYYITITINKIKDKEKIKKITNLGLINDYVYDLETENHHFAAGIGEIIVHNTDSVFFNPKITDIETGEVQKDKRALEIAIMLGTWASDAICKLLPDPQKMAYEKVLYPFAILTKKRYVGNLYESDPNKYYQKSMGIVLKRRDNAPIVKVVFGGIVNQILNNKSAKGAVEYTKKTLKQILMDKYPIDKFIITKTLKEKYKDRTRITHAVLADRMAKRDPGNKPLPNDRIPYAYIQVDHEVELQGDRVEHPDYIRENNLKLDYLFYITNQIMVPSVQFLELLVNNPEQIFNEYIVREKNRRKGFKPVNSFLKQNEEKDSENDFDDLSDSDELLKKPVKTRAINKKKIIIEEFSDSDNEDF